MEKQLHCMWMLLILAGCGASVSRVAIKPSTKGLERGSRVSITVTGIPAVALTEEEREFLGKEIVSRLAETGKFSDVHLRNNISEGDHPDYVVRCELSRLFRVSRGRRVASGLLAGGSDPAMAEVNVTILAGSAQRVMIAGALISGKSSWGWSLFSGYGMFTGTTEEAFQKVAEGIATFASEQVR